ncbi:MAG: hypothetical protein RLZZ540_1138 [Bacteroidota bacterium]
MNCVPLFQKWVQIVSISTNQNSELMKVTDLNGCLIEVSNLDEAIEITKQYTEYQHEDESFSDFDRRQKAYWKDMHEKLTAIKGDLTTL